MKPYNKTSVILTLVLVSLIAISANGQEFWEKKPYQSWSEKEARKLLTDSPWADRHTLSQTIIQPLQSPGAARAGTNPLENIEGARSPDPGARTDEGRARQARPEIRYEVQFRSALPIRQAIVRLSQINAKYDEMAAEQKQAFDKSVDAFLAKKFPDTVILYISFNSNVPVDEREMARHWQAQTTEQLKNFVFLILPGGEKVPLLGYAVAQGGSREFQFVFPRMHQGRPIVGDQDKKKLQLEFIHPKIRDQRESRVLLSFNTEKMMMDGVAVY